MGRKILVIVDMQNDFITGTLGTPEARNTIPYIVNLIPKFKDNNIILTKDTHNKDTYYDSLEGKHLPIPHCLYGSEGWLIVPETKKALENRQYTSITKTSFGSSYLASFLEKEDHQAARHKNHEERIEEIHIVGVCTDVCVITNAAILKTALPNVEIYVHEKGCAGTLSSRHVQALNVMRSFQINIVED